MTFLFITNMRIAFIVSQFPTLSETFILNQITGLIKRGHKVDIYAFHDQKVDVPKMHPDVEKYCLLNRTYYSVPIPNNRFSRMLKSLGLLCTNAYKAPLVLLRSLNFKYRKQFISPPIPYAVIPLLDKRTSYDIIHCHFGRNGLKGVLLREIGAIQGKVIVTFHGQDVNVIPRQYGKDIYKELFQKGDLYTVNTTFTKGRAIALGCPEDKIIKLPVGIDISKYTFQERILPSGKPIKLFTVGRLVEKKGIEYSIKAVAKVLKSHPNIVYEIAGDGPLHASLKNLIVELDLSDKVKLLGWMTQDEVRQLYADAHIFILSSVTASNGDKEGQGLVLQESQAMGLPVLSTLHNGIPDGVLDGKSGFLVPERDVDALAEKLSYLLAHPQSWAEMGRVGRAYVEKHYDIDKLNDQLVEIYSVALKSNELGRNGNRVAIAGNAATTVY